jgi:hypothetical protein
MNMPQNGEMSPELLEALASKLGPEDKKLLQSLLSDRDACQKILNTPEAQQLLRKFKGGK